MRQVCWHTQLIEAVSGLRHEDYKPEASLGCKTSPRLKNKTNQTAAFELVTVGGIRVAWAFMFLRFH